MKTWQKNAYDKTPIAPIVNAYTGGLFDKAKKLIDILPDGTVKDKLNNYTDKAEEMRMDVKMKRPPMVGVPCLV